MNSIIISGQSTIIFDSLCSGPQSRTRLKQQKNRYSASLTCCSVTADVTPTAITKVQCHKTVFFVTHALRQIKLECLYPSKSTCLHFR